MFEQLLWAFSPSQCVTLSEPQNGRIQLRRRPEGDGCCSSLPHIQKTQRTAGAERRESRKQLLWRKAGFIFRFLISEGKFCSVLFGNTSSQEHQSSESVLSCFTSFDGKQSNSEDVNALIHSKCFPQDPKQTLKVSESIYTWRRGSTAAAFGSSELEIEHLGLITCDKIQSKKTSSHALDHHTVRSLSTFFTLSALHSYEWYKWWNER